MKTRNLTAALVGVIGLAAAASAQTGQTVYAENFETRSAFPEWSLPVFESAPGTPFTRFHGRFQGWRTTLTINLPEPLRNASSDNPSDPGDPGNPGEPGLPYLLEFDFYCIDSWDGSEPTYGPDRFHVFLNTSTASLVNDTFANQHTFQSYPGQPVLGRAQLGYSDANDSIYHFVLPFDAAPGVNQIHFEAFGMQSMADESWGIDNVRVSVVPAPGGAAALIVGIAAFGRRRRA